MEWAVLHMKNRAWKNELILSPARRQYLLERQLQRYRSRLVPAAAWMQRAAVAAVMRQRQERSELLFIRRAEDLNDPWSGHMAFPGGRYEPIDLNSRATAERETREELALDLPGHGRLMGRMSDIMATAGGRHLPLVITPWVYTIDEDPVLCPNEEVAEALWVPMSYFQDPSNREYFNYNAHGMNLQLPCYHYKGRTIWGLTLQMVDELLDIDTRAQHAARELYMREIMGGEVGGE